MMGDADSQEFYIPTESSSVHFLKTKLCVGCTKGFEIVDLETLDMQGLLDPSDSSLDFVLKRDNVRPIAIYRIEEDFLLCYDGASGDDLCWLYLMCRIRVLRKQERMASATEMGHHLGRRTLCLR